MNVANRVDLPALQKRWFEGRLGRRTLGRECGRDGLKQFGLIRHTSRWVGCGLQVPGVTKLAFSSERRRRALDREPAAFTRAEGAAGAIGWGWRMRP